MADPCSGGPTTLRPGVQNTAVLSSAAIEAVLLFVAEPLAALLAVPLAQFDYDSFTICSSPPPDDPGLTPADAANVLNFADPTVSGPAIQKLHTWFLSWYWYTLCECASTATPAPPTPSNPGGHVSSNPGLPTGPAAAPCWSVDTNLSVPHSVNLIDYSPFVFPEFATQAITPGFTGGPTAAPVIPTGASGLHMEWTLDHNPTPPNDVNLLVKFYNASGAHLTDFGVSWDGTPALHLVNNFTFPAGATAWLAVLNNGDPGAHNVEFKVSFLCGGQSNNAPTVPCCPPDPLLETYLRQILGLLQSLYEGAAVPLRSYADSTVHAGLSGNGTLTLGATTLAVRVTLTTVPSSLGREAEAFTFYFDAGWITPVAVMTPMTSWRVSYSPQLFPLPALTDQVGYSFAHGVVASITELVRGP